MSNTVLRWHGEKAKGEVKAEVNKRVNRAARWLASFIKVKLSVANRGNERRDNKGKFLKRSRGENPSKPGEYPKKVTGRLRSSITHEMDRESSTARVGTNVKYGKWLELGTRKMAPRPWLSRAWKETITQLRAILAGAGS